MQLALWVAVLLGAVGGVVGLLRSPQAADGEVPVRDDDWIVPAPVAGYAELVVEEWLSRSPEGRAAMAPLFVEAPPSTEGGADDDVPGIEVVRVVAVGGERTTDDYWTVTVRADVTGEAATAPPGTDEEGDPAPEDEGPASDVVAWFLQVGMVGDGHGSYVALAAPAVIPPPEGTTGAWELAVVPEALEDQDDPLALTVQEFLDALLADQGPVSRYLAPGVELDPASPPPFVSVSVEGIAREVRDDGDVWVLAEVLAEVPGGVELPLTYDLILTKPADQWEVRAFSGAPTLIERQEP